MVDRRAAPPLAEQGNDVVDETAPLGIADSARSPLAGLIEPRHQADQQTAAAQSIELGKLLGEQHRVASDRDQVRSELQPLRAARCESESDEGVDRRAHRYVGQPDGVEAERFQGVDEFGQHVAVPHLDSWRYSEPDLHDSQHVVIRIVAAINLASWRSSCSVRSTRHCAIRRRYGSCGGGSCHRRSSARRSRGTASDCGTSPAPALHRR